MPSFEVGISEQSNANTWGISSVMFELSVSGHRTDFRVYYIFDVAEPLIQFAVCRCHRKLRTQCRVYQILLLNLNRRLLRCRRSTKNELYALIYISNEE